MSRDIYKSLHEMDSFDATTMGIICYTQKNKNVSKNIYWFFIDVTKVCIICTLSEHGIKVKQKLGDPHRIPDTGGCNILYTHKDTAPCIKRHTPSIILYHQNLTDSQEKSST